MRTHGAGRTPQHKDVHTLVHFMRDNGDIASLNKVTDIQKLLVYGIDRLLADPLRRQHGHAVLLFHAQNDVPSAPVVDVVCECANRMEHLFGIPVLLVFDPSTLYLTLVNQVVYVQR